MILAVWRALWFQIFAFLAAPWEARRDVGRWLQHRRDARDAVGGIEAMGTRDVLVHRKLIEYLLVMEAEVAEQDFALAATKTAAIRITAARARALAAIAEEGVTREQ